MLCFSFTEVTVLSKICMATIMVIEKVTVMAMSATVMATLTEIFLFMARGPPFGRYQM